MESEDTYKNVPRKEQNTSSSDDDDVFFPMRKKIKTDSVSDESSSEEDIDTCSEQCTQETVLTGTSGGTAEESENVAENGAEQDHPAVAMVITDNDHNSPALGQNTHEQTDINDSVSDDTNTDSATNLESTVLPETRYVIPLNLLHRPSTSKCDMKHNIPCSQNETVNKHHAPNMTGDVSENIEQIRQSFISSWDRILAADDLIPDTELVKLNSTTPDKICEYLYETGVANSRDQALRELVPGVCDEICNLQQANESVTDFETFEPEPEPIPINDLLSDPLDLLETAHEHPMSDEELQFDTDHWCRIQQAFIIPEQLPDFGQLFTNNGILIPSSIEEASPSDNTLEYQPLTDVPNELAHIYNAIIREAVTNQYSDGPTFGQPIATRVQSGDPYFSPTFMHSDSNPIQLNHDPDLFRSVQGITSPFGQNENTFNEEIAMPVLDNCSPVHTLNRPVETECVPTQIFSSISEVDSNPAEFDLNIVEIDSASVDCETNPAEFEVNIVELDSASVDFETNPAELETNPAALDMNPAELNASPAELNASPAELPSNTDVFEANSNQDDSDASTPSASNAYGGCAQFVVLPSNNNFKPLKIFVVSPSDAGDDNDNIPSDETPSDERTLTADEETDVEEEINGVHVGNYLAMQEMNHFETEMSTIETEINVIIEEADRFEQQAARFEETAENFHEVASFFRQISEIFESAAMSLQQAVDNFEVSPIEEATGIAYELDPLAEGIAIEDDNVPDQEVPDVEHDTSL